MKRYKDYAARGPDAWCKADLVHMPDAAVSTLLTKLHQIEQGHTVWPPQILIGFVCSLLKPGGRTDASAYRPIVLVSLIYRVWAGIRSRQILRQLAPLLPPDCLGFVPGRETTEYWYHIQTQIELCCQGAYDLYGMSCDVIKAYNNLPRLPIARMASHIGLPEHITRPWFAFANGLCRHFLVRDCLSCGVMSSSGFAEGCPLSPVAMVLTDLSLSLYNRAFAPAVQSISYVDNWSCLAHQVGALATGINTTRTFCDSLSLELDPQKTYVWSAGTAGKRDLAALGIPVLDSTRELGGTLAFGSRVRNAAVAARCRSLDPLWSRLRRLPAPITYKTSVLPSKFWASALHGIAGVPIGDGLLSSLRTAAVRALHANSAGTSPMLRLSLSGVFEADPGFWQAWVCIRDLRRMLRKLPGLLGRWRTFQAHFDGRLFQGPFSKLLQVFGHLGWHLLTPPLITDREGLRHCLISAAPQLLYQLAVRDWLAYVADNNRHRKTMLDLVGLEPSLALLDRSQLSLLDTSRTLALQSGAFLTSASHAKYDASQTGVCSICHVLDTVQHRVCQCPRFQEARQGCEWISQDWHHMPVCLSHHLLPPAIPELQQLRILLHELPDETALFVQTPGRDQVHHLFTDGACAQHACPDLNLASWGVVCANSGSPVSSGLVPGLLQTAPRGELQAIISAFRWAVRFQVWVVIWSDAKWLVDKLQHLLTDGVLASDLENSDLWDVIAMLADQLSSGQLWVKHVPSHLDVGLCSSPFEEWVAQHNNHVDQVAAVANAGRSQAFLELHARASRVVQATAARIRGLRQIYMRIADCTALERARQTDPRDHDHVEPQAVALPEAVQFDSVQDLLPLTWRQGLGEVPAALPSSFLSQVLATLALWADQGSAVYPVTWIELAFLFAREEGFRFPVYDTHTRSWRCAHEVPFSDTRTSVSAALRFVKQAFCTAAKLLGISLPRTPPISLVEFRVYPPQGGIYVCCPDQKLTAAREALISFCQTRPFRVAADLSRPI